MSTSVANSVGVGCKIFLANAQAVVVAALVEMPAGTGKLLWVAGTMVTLSGNLGGVSFGTLGEGAGQSVWSTPAGEGCGAFRLGAVEGLVVTLEKMRESVWMALNWSSPSVANGVGFKCKRASASAQAAVVEALVELLDGTRKSWGGESTVLAMRSAQVRGM